MEVVDELQVYALNGESLWHRYSKEVCKYLLRLVGDRETAEDLTQETFMQVSKHLRRATFSPDNAKAWVFRIATNQAMDHFRRRRLVKWVPFVPERHGGTVEDVGELVARNEKIQLALSKLTSESAAILLLRDGHGFTTLEIAAMIGQNNDAVCRRLARSREIFRVEYLK